MVREDLLHYVWLHQYFDKTHLTTTQGQAIQILHPGYLNKDAGPDFSETRFRMDGLEWMGHTEVHVCSSDWFAHGHQHDGAYDSVALHVVWEDDNPLLNASGHRVPTLVLGERVKAQTLEQYERLHGFSPGVPCGESLSLINPLVVENMLEKVLIERLEHKAKQLLREAESLHWDWEEVAYRRLAYAMGMKINGESMLKLAGKVPYRLLKKQTSDISSEALLFGQAGMLKVAFKDEYPQSLKKEYQFLAKKYDLPEPMLEWQWKYMRTRPANFPTLRIAQLGYLLRQWPSLFSMFVECVDPKSFLPEEVMPLSTYWQNHYLFDEESKKCLTSLGQQVKDSILINTIVPLKIAYGKAKGSPERIDEALALLMQLAPEKNKFVDLGRSLHLSLSTAFASQAFLGLYQNYCIKNRCMYCAIGNEIMKRVCLSS